MFFTLISPLTGLIHESGLMQLMKCAAVQRAGSKVNPVRVLCVEDNQPLAEALGCTLSRDCRFDWLGWVSTKSQLLSEARHLSPDVVCLDLNIPGQDTFEMVGALKGLCPAARVLVLTGALREDVLCRMVDAGAWGYISKAEEPQTIIEAIWRVAAGQFVLGRISPIGLRSPAKRRRAAPVTISQRRACLARSA